ncbi:hypothetical protein SDC9_107147 [bioreactor metagenome]|uniref:Uncharacterized protein n=1 Tax=bioreactor metagenome TaxID=1076179 RepID=A0A645B5G0_9ZZZZ
MCGAHVLRSLGLLGCHGILAERNGRLGVRKLLFSTRQGVGLLLVDRICRVPLALGLGQHGLRICQRLARTHDLSGGGVQSGVMVVDVCDRLLELGLQIGLLVVQIVGSSRSSERAETSDDDQSREHPPQPRSATGKSRWSSGSPGRTLSHDTQPPVCTSGMSDAEIPPRCDQRRDDRQNNCDDRNQADRHPGVGPRNPR